MKERFRSRQAKALRKVLGDNFRPELCSNRSDPFTHISLDIMAPIKVKQTVKARTERAVYPIIFTCLTTTSLHSKVAVSYSTEDFMLQFDKFCSIRGKPTWVYTDMGSQLVKAQAIQGSGGQGLGGRRLRPPRQPKASDGATPPAELSGATPQRQWQRASSTR